MTSLVDICNSWNLKQQAYYQPLLTNLQDIHITTAEELCSQDIEELFNNTKIAKQIIKAFIKQVIYDTLPSSTTTETLPRVYISTGFDCVDKLFLPTRQGISSHHVIELRGTINSNASMMMANILSSFILHYNSIQNICIYDTASGMLSSTTSIATTLLKRGLPDPTLLSQIESQQLLSTRHLVDSLENLIALSFTNGLIIIDDLSFLLNYDWSNPIVKEIVKQVKILARRNGCIVIFLRDTDTKEQLDIKLEAVWNPMIDTRLFFPFSDDGGAINTVEMIKSRHQLINTSTSCTIQTQ